MTVGRTRSIRVPHGLPERIEAATGMNFSEFVRVVATSALAVFERDRELQAANKATAAAVEQLVEETLHGKS